MAVLDGNIIPFTQDEIETVVREIYRNNGVSDVDFEGSNVSQLATVMSYVISTLNTNTAANLSEVILPLATKLKPVQYGARHVGYEPHRRISYQYDLGIFSVFNPDTIGQTINYVIPRNTVLNSGSNSYYYLGEDIIDSYISPANEAGIILIETIAVKEGVFKFYDDNVILTHIANEEYDSQGELTVKQDYLIPFNDIENAGLQVFLSYTDPIIGTITRELWTQSDTFIVDSTFDQLENSYVVANNIYLNQPVVKFKIGGYGQGIVRSSIIEINALISKGLEGVADGDFTFEDNSISALIAIGNTTLKVRGQDIENIDDIKANAPIFNNTANRAVTRLDYIALAQKHASVNRVECWGGEEVLLDSEVFLLRSFSVFDDNLTTLGVSPLDMNGDITPGWTEDDFSGTESPWDALKTYANGESAYVSASEEDKFALGAVWLSVTPELTELTYSSNDILLNTLYTADRLTDLSNWYLIEGNETGGEIYKPDVPSSSDQSLMKYLDPYKIMTLNLTHRQPAYLDFNYSINVIKYNAVKAARDTNSEIFDIITEYFDSQIRDFNTENINSNLIRRIDDLLTDVSGIEISLDTSLSFTDSSEYLYSQNTPDIFIGVNANANNVNIHATRMYLALPFGDVYNNSNELVVDRIPKVDTVDYQIGNDLYMYLPNATIPYSDEIKIELRRVSDDLQIGEYNIQNELGFIEIILYDVTTNCNMVNNIGKLDVVYADKLNFPVTKNVMPRLRTVAFN